MGSVCGILKTNFSEIVDFKMNRTENCTSESAIDGSIKVWTIVEITAIVFSLLSLYLLLSSILFAVMDHRKKRLKKYCRGTNDRWWVEVVLSLTIPTSHAFVLSAFATLLFPLFKTESKQKELSYACTAFTLVETWCHNLGLIFAYLMLWLRIKMFFYNKVVKTLQSKRQRVSLNIVLIVMIFACLQSAVNTSTDIENIEYSCGRCVIIVTLQHRYKNLISLILMTVGTSICMVILAVLLIYPLKSNRRQLSSRTHTYIRKLSMRIFSISVVCLLVYVAAALVTLIAAVGYGFQSNVIHNLIFDLMLFLNILLITISFANWRVRLFPPYEQIFGDKKWKNLTTNNQAKTSQILNTVSASVPK